MILASFLSALLASCHKTDEPTAPPAQGAPHEKAEQTSYADMFVPEEYPRQQTQYQHHVPSLQNFINIPEAPTGNERIVSKKFCTSKTLFTTGKTAPPQTYDNQNPGACEMGPFEFVIESYPPDTFVMYTDWPLTTGGNGVMSRLGSIFWEDQDSLLGKVTYLTQSFQCVKDTTPAPTPFRCSFLSAQDARDPQQGPHMIVKDSVNALLQNGFFAVSDAQKIQGYLSRLDEFAPQVPRE